MGIIYCMRKNNNSFIKEINCLFKLKKKYKILFLAKKNKAAHIWTASYNKTISIIYSSLEISLVFTVASSTDDD